MKLDKIIGILIITILAIIIIPKKVNAESLAYQFNSYAVRDNGTWTSHQSFGNNFSSKVVNGLSIRLGVDNKFRAGTTYRIVYETGFSNITIAIEDVLVLQPTSVNCYGSINYNSWSSDAGLIGQCTLIGASRVGTTTGVRYIIEFSPVQDIKGFQTNFIYSNTRYTISSTNVYNTTSITYPTDISSTIQEQTVIIQNEIDNLIDKDHTYTGEEEIEDTKDLIDTIADYEEDIMEYLNMETPDITLNWNTGALNFIWMLIDEMRIGIIVSIFNGMLIIGLIKLLLNR